MGIGRNLVAYPVGLLEDTSFTLSCFLFMTGEYIKPSWIFIKDDGPIVYLADNAHIRK